MTNQPPERSGAGDEREYDDDHDFDAWDHGEPIDPHAMVRVTEKGRRLFEQLMEAVSIEAGREVSPDEVTDALAKLSAATGEDDPDLGNPIRLEMFLSYLHGDDSA